MPVKRKTINLSVSGNALTATDAQTGLLTTDAGVQGEDGAVWFHAAVPSDWQDLSVRLQVLALSGGFDESDLAAGGVIDMPLRQALTVPGRLSVRLVGSDTGGVRRTADCVTLTVAPSAVAADPVPHLYPYPVHRITGSGGALVTQTDNSTWNVDVSGTGGDMLKANYASGAGAANANKVDHAVAADTAEAASAAASGSALESTINGLWVPPAIFACDLQNGWSHYENGFREAFYYQAQNRIVYIDGVVCGGTTASGTLLFTLPAGMRPASTVIRTVLTTDAGYSAVYLTTVYIYADGGVKLGTVGNGSAKNVLLNLGDIAPFLGEH